MTLAPFHAYEVAGISEADLKAAAHDNVFTYRSVRSSQRRPRQAVGSIAGANELDFISSFGILAATTITDAGASVLTGSLALYPGTAITGFPPATVSGTTDLANARALAIKNAATALYNDIVAMTPDANHSGIDLGTLTLTPGVYKFDTSAGLTGTVTLDAGGDANAQWFFQIGTTLTTAAAATVSIINGGSADNVYWQVGTSATLGATNAFKGNIIANVAITVGATTAILGRLMALTGAVTLDGDTIGVGAMYSHLPAAGMSIGSKDFTFVKNGTGDYTLTFVNDFVRTPMAFLGVHTPGVVGNIYAISSSSVQVKFFDVSAPVSALDADFDIMVQGYDEAEELV